MQEKGEGGFLFISHSHKDMDRVRQLRNRLEDEGFEPLCFYLKCLDDNTDELDDLIKREIDARQWFVYAVSKNSRASEWVQKECRWRTRRESSNRQILRWDLESNRSIDEISDRLIEGLRVNIIHSHKDKIFVDRLKAKLIERDFQVTTGKDINPSNPWEDEIEENIETASGGGTNIVILSRNSLDSKSMINEVRFAFSLDSLIIPVYIDDVVLQGDLKFYLTPCHMIFSNKPIRNEKDLDVFIERVVDETNAVLERYF